MQFYWSFLLVYLIRLTEAKNCSLPLILNGHYIIWPSKKTEEQFIDNLKFIPKNIIYTKFQLYYNRVFLAAPRYRRGVPFTLGYVVLTDKDISYNYVKPFPCMERNNEKSGECDNGSLVNVIDLVIGQDGVLWVLDIGMSDTLSEFPSRDGEPKIVGIDAVTGEIKYMISLKTLVNWDQSQLQNLAVEYLNKDNIILYVGDGGTRSIIVYNVLNNKGSRIKLPRSIENGCLGNSQNDVFSMVLIKLKTGHYIYFTYLSGQDIFRIRTKYLQTHMHPNCVVNLGKKPCEMVFIGVGHESSVIFFRIRSQNDMYSWNTNKNFLQENFMIARQNKDCRMITHVHFDCRGVMWILESNIQDFVIDDVGCFGPSIMLMPVYDIPIAIPNNYNISENECINDEF